MSQNIQSTAEYSSERISPWWLRILIAVVIFATGVLVYLTVNSYNMAPPIPEKVVDSQGQIVSTKADILNGQSIFQRYGLMNNGSVWGHGAYMGPDYSADALHREVEILHEAQAQSEFHQSFADIDGTRQAAIKGEVSHLLKRNDYNAHTGTLALTDGEARAWQTAPGHWLEFFHDPAKNAGLKPDLITDPQQLHELSAFFQWAAWASTAVRPGKEYSYTNNFPFDPDAGNTPVKGAVIWTALSLITLLGGIGGAVYIRDRYPSAAWVTDLSKRLPSRLNPAEATPAQKALGKFMVVAVALFFFQTLVGGAVAHYRAEPDNFYGIPLQNLFPSNLLRTWHLQSAIFWIAVPYVAATLYLAISMRPKNDPLANSAILKWIINGLFGAFFVVIAGTFLGVWAGYSQILGKYWEFFGATGWEFMEQGQIWHILLLVGLLAWFGLLCWLSRPAPGTSKEDRALIKAFLISALAIPVFYIPVLFIGHDTNYSIVETWRFWIIHLWVEGYFEFFATTLGAVMFYMLGITRLKTALEVIFFDGILFFLGGVLGTCHHWYFSGQGQSLMAIGALMSAMEVVPLTLLTAEAWDFYKATRLDTNGQGRVVHTYTFAFLMASGFWNFIGAGVCGFFINTPIMSYYEVGTMLTPNHGHAAMMGVFGMLALSMIALVLQNISSVKVWEKMEGYFKVAFVGTNLGLALMCLTSLFPGGLLQLWDVINHGYWHARSLAYTRSDLAVTIEWIRMFGDVVFIVFGSLPLLIGALRVWCGLFKKEA